MRAAGNWVAVLVLAAALVGCVPLPAPEVAGSPLAAPATQFAHRYSLPMMVGEPSKVGVSMALAYRSCADPAQVGAVWYYDWSPYPLQCSGLEAVPMIWSPGNGYQAGPLPDSDFLLLFNECDLVDQCDVTPERAAISWRQYEQAYPDRKLVGPNISHLGLQWLLAWRAAYIRFYGEPPRIWALGVHCYASLEFCQAWVEQNIALARKWTESGRVWVSEWAMSQCITGAASADLALAESDAFLDFLLANPGVEREAWFIARSPGQRCQTELIGPDGTLTEFGLWYRDAVKVDW
jgi:hypothetical protein